MDWFTGTIVYLLIWWLALFCVLPIGTRPVDEADPAGGWRGAPARPLLGRKLIGTTILAAVLWIGVDLVIRSGWVSFREGWFAYDAPASTRPPGGGAQN